MHLHQTTRAQPADLAVIVVSANDARWLEPCLSSVLDHAGDAAVEIVVVDNASTDGTTELVRSRFPRARVVGSPNLGFAYGNNRGLECADARYVLLLNPDTEILDGTLGELIAALDAQPDVGLVGVRQLDAEGVLVPTIRRFPNAARAFGEALYSEHWPVRPAWSGERVLDPGAYTREYDCDWISGSFMLIRREALRSAGVLDERFFLYSEETDLCLRVGRAGWRVSYLPQMTIRHHAGKAGVRPALVAQDALSRKLYARKHFAPVHRSLFLMAVGLGHLIRLAAADRAGTRRREEIVARRESSGRALRTLLGRAAPPFVAPLSTAVGSAPAAAVELSDAPSELSAATVELSDASAELSAPTESCSQPGSGAASRRERGSLFV